MTTCENYGAYSHQQIHHEMYDGSGPASQADAVAGWRELSVRLDRIRHYLNAAVGGVRESQQGAAADAAVGAMLPLRSWLDEAQKLANDTRDRIDHQVSEFTRARNSIPEVPPAPRGWGWQDLPVIDSFTTSDQEADEAFNAEQERQARAVMMAYQTSTNERVVSVPQFAPPPSGEPDLTMPTATRSTIGGIPGGGPAGGAVAGAPASLTGTGGGTPAELLAPVPAPTGPQGGPEPPGPRPAPVAPVPPPGTTVGIPPTGVVPGTSATGRPRTPGSGRVGVGRGGAGGGPAVPRGGPGIGGAPGGRGLGGFGPDGGASGLRPDRGAGGFGPSGSPESAAARAAGAAGAAGTGAGRGAAAAGPGMVPFGGTGRGGEDRERQRPSYLVESDPNRLIGKLPPTAPPVIGEDPPAPDEHDRR